MDAVARESVLKTTVADREDAVLAEETTNETLAARNRAFEQLFFSIAFVVFCGLLTLVLGR